MSKIQEFKKLMLDEKRQNNELASLTELTSNSKTSRWNLFLYIVAFFGDTLWQLWQQTRKEIDVLVHLQRHVNIAFLRKKLLNYRDGHPFDKETLSFKGNYTDEQIELSKIVKRAAVQAITLENRKLLKMKIAGEDSNGLKKLPQSKVKAIKTYIEAHGEGTLIDVQSLNPDDLRFEFDVYIDNQILQTDGTRVDGTANTPVPDAIQEFLASKNFKFDGELVLSLLIDAIQQVEGVESRAVNIKVAQSNYQLPLEWQDIDERYTSQSGYFKLLPENLKINYKIRNA